MPLVGVNGQPIASPLTEEAEVTRMKALIAACQDLFNEQKVTLDEATPLLVNLLVQTVEPFPFPQAQQRAGAFINTALNALKGILERKKGEFAIEQRIAQSLDANRGP